MKVLMLPIFALFLAAKAVRLPECSEDAGLSMVLYVTKAMALLPTATMAHQIEEAFPDIMKTGGYKEAVGKVNDCLLDSSSRNLTVCARLDAIPNCKTLIGEYYEKNLPEHFKDIAKLVPDSYVAAVRHVCTSKAEDFFELTNRCLFKPGTQEKRDEVKKVLEEKSKVFKAAPTKANLCGYVHSLKPLIEAHIELVCESEVTVKAFKALSDASVTPCEEK